MKTFEKIDGLKVEPIYGTKYISERIPEEKLKAWATATRRDDEHIGYSPPNPYIPELPLVPCRRERPDD